MINKIYENQAITPNLAKLIDYDNDSGDIFISVLQMWVMKLPLRTQGTVLTGVRGCDLTPKYPLDSCERNLTAFIRYAIMNPFDDREIDKEPGCFMQSRINFDIFKPSKFGEYPLHYVMHLIHTLEVIAFYSPVDNVAKDAWQAYHKFVISFHLNPETFEQMTARLNEDRLKNNSIVEDSPEKIAAVFDSSQSYFGDEKINIYPENVGEIKRIYFKNDTEINCSELDNDEIKSTSINLLESLE